MKILLCSIGSRGDIQPFLVLGDFLTSKGCEVKVASAEMYRAMAAGYDVEYEAFEGDYASIIDDEQMKKAIGSNPLTMRKNLHEKVYPIIQSSLQTFYELSQWADIVIYHPKTLVDTFSAHQQHKLIKAYVVPAFTPTAAFANPLLAFLPIPSFLNRFTYTLTNALMSTVKKPVKDFKKVNQLQPSPSLLQTPILYGISPAFLPRPDDYPVDHHFTGFWQAKVSAPELPQPVLDFVSSPRKTMLITFGSMPYHSAVPIDDFVKAIRQKYDINVLIVRAWGLRDAAIHQGQHVMAIDGAPFSQLFPLVDFVLHHGGAGTIATALQAGVPQFICPVLHPFGDQFFWGLQIEKRGLGPKPTPLKKLTISKLLKAVDQWYSGDFNESAKKLKVQINQEDGLEEVWKLVAQYHKNSDFHKANI